MSEENIKAAQRAYAGINSRGEPPADLFADELTVDVTDASPELGVTRDREAVRRLIREYIETFEEFHVELEEVIHADKNFVITAVRDGGRMRGSRTEVRNRFFHVIEFDDTKITAWASYTDRHRALEAAGLSE
jgi:ketosteroid isomerase-like protein